MRNLDLYRHSIDVALDSWRKGLCDAEAVIIAEDMLLLRAVTVSDVLAAKDAEVRIFIPENADTLEETIAYEIVAVGPGIDPNHVGKHCQHIASTADALAIGAEGARYFAVRSKWVPIVYSPRELLKAITLASEEHAEAVASEARAEAVAREALQGVRKSLVSTR